MKRILALTVLLAGCSPKPDCTDPKGHTWGKWESTEGRLIDRNQIRECQTCGIKEWSYIYPSKPL